MKAALKTKKGEFEVKDVARPEIPHPDWVLARVKVAGICGTDLRHWQKEEPQLECKIMGHELAGEVLEVGPAVTHVKPGDRVVMGKGLTVEAFATDHVVPSLGYHLWHGRRHLAPAFAGLPPAELIRLREQGVETAEVIEDLWVTCGAEEDRRVTGEANPLELDRVVG